MLRLGTTVVVRLTLAMTLMGCAATVGPGTHGDGGADAAADAPPPTTTPDDGFTCGQPPWLCVAGTAGGACGDGALQPACINGAYQCPAGTIPSIQCRCAGRPPAGCTCGSAGWVCPDAGTTTSATFACGASLRCAHGAQYCEVARSDTGEPDAYNCRALPGACSAGALTCACLTDPARMFCTQSDAGDLTVEFPGG